MHRLPCSLVLALMVSAACSAPESAAPDPAPGGKADDFDYSHNLRVDSVWVEDSDTPGKQYIAILDEDSYSHSEHVVLYGEKNGTLRVRDFQGSNIIFDHAGYTETSSDNFYDFKAEFVTDDRMEVTLEGFDGTTYNLGYERQQLNETLIAGAEAAANKFYEKYDELRNDGVTTLSDLKKHVRLHMRTHGYGPNDSWGAYEWQFETHWLQIEGHVELSASNEELAGVEISDDASDAVSQHYLASVGANAFSSWADVPEPEEVLDNHDWNDDLPSYYMVEQGIDGVEPGPIRDGLDMFATHTFKELTPFECEGGYDYIVGYTWYLPDGSIVRYSIYPECD